MESNLAASMQPIYDPRRVNITHQQPKPDSTVPSPPGSENKVLEAANESTLADLASSEISLDLQGLIDDAHFGADAENLFGDLIDNGQKRDYVRLSPVNSLGSSANSSPGNGADPSHDPHSLSNNYRSLAYLPGSVHGASQLQNPQQQQQHNNNNTALPSITTLGNAVFVKQEPEDQHMKRQMQHAVVASAALAAAGQNNVNAGYVSSTTHMNGYNLPNRPVNGQPNAAAVISTKKKKVDRSSDEYRRRRERNNAAVQKSREKTKIRTRNT